MSIQCTIPLLCISAAAHSSFYTPESLSTTTTISSFFYLLIVSVHLVHPYAQCFCMLFMSSALPVHHCNSSASLAVKPMCPSSLGVMLRFLSLSNSQDSLSSLSQSSSSSLLQLQASTLIHLSIASTNSLHSTGRFLETLQLLWQSHRSLFESSGRNHQWFLAVTL
jgi:hypothetical protein